MSAALPLPRAAGLAIDYVHADPRELLAGDDVLAVFGFGRAAPAPGDPRWLRVGLEPHGAAPLEVWRTPNGRVARGVDADGVRWADDGTLAFGALEVAEPPGEDGLEACATAVYATVLSALARRGGWHLLRMWNYLDGITAGEGDAERYRRFCVGRARGLALDDATVLPAATAIGRRDGVRALQVYWLAARAPGTPLENPRQVSAYRYPRQYGPQPPSFARAMLPDAACGVPLLLSGTAAIVGHASQHADSVECQVDETLSNIDALLAAAHARRPELPRSLGPCSRLKVYVRDAADLPRVAAHLDARLGPDVPRLLLHAAICRRELRVEIDGVHG